MKSNIQDNIAATSTQCFEAFLATSGLYFDGIGQLSELALSTARKNVEDCVSVAKAMGSPETIRDPQALQTSFGQPMLERALAYSTEACQIIAQTQQQAAKVLATKFPPLAIEWPTPTGLDAAMNMFSRGLNELSTMTSTNMAAATDAVATLGRNAKAESRKSA